MQHSLATQLTRAFTNVSHPNIPQSNSPGHSQMQLTRTFPRVERMTMLESGFTSSPKVKASTEACNATGREQMRSGSIKNSLTNKALQDRYQSCLPLNPCARNWCTALCWSWCLLHNAVRAVLTCNSVAQAVPRQLSKHPCLCGARCARCAHLGQRGAARPLVVQPHLQGTQ